MAGAVGRLTLTTMKSSVAVELVGVNGVRAGNDIPALMHSHPCATREMIMQTHPHVRDLA